MGWLTAEESWPKPISGIAMRHSQLSRWERRLMTPVNLCEHWWFLSLTFEMIFGVTRTFFGQLVAYFFWLVVCFACLHTKPFNPRSSVTVSLRRYSAEQPNKSRLWFVSETAQKERHISCLSTRSSCIQLWHSIEINPATEFSSIFFLPFSYQEVFQESCFNMIALRYFTGLQEVRIPSRARIPLLGVWLTLWPFHAKTDRFG